MLRLIKEKLQKGHSWFRKELGNPYHTERFAMLSEKPAARANQLEAFAIRGAGKAEELALHDLQAQYASSARGMSGRLTDLSGAIKSPFQKMGKYLLVGGAIAGGAALLSSMGAFGGSKKGKDAARLDGEMEAARERTDSMVLTSEQLLPGQETMMGMPPQPGPLTDRFRPNGPVVPSELTSRGADAKGAPDLQLASPA